MSERRPFTRDGFAKMLATVAVRAGIENVHPHALRHATGHALAMKGARHPADPGLPVIQHTNLAMQTWVLVIILLVNSQPLGITSVSGYTSLVDCGNAGNRLHNEEIKYGRHIDFDCIAGPSR